LTVDHYDEDWSHLAWVQALGPVAIIDAPDAPDAIGVLTSRYPQYQVRAPAGPVLKLTPERVLWWRA
jgi:hypothetical protein